MAGKFFGIPFASTGDKTAVPDSVQPDGSVSYSEGFGFDYERADTDPAYKPVPREQTNQLYFDLTQAVGIIQKQGYADWTSAAAPYAVAATVRHNSAVWRNKTASNSDEPGVGAGATSWENITSVTVPDASETVKGIVELATNAEVVAGTDTVRAVTPAGLASLTATDARRGLVELATNAETQAGTATDRAVTPANLNSTVLGLGQTWQDVTASRAAATNYTNTTGKPITICVSFNYVGNGTSSITVGGVLVNRFTFGLGGTGATMSAIIPAGSVYSAQGNIGIWVELR